MGLTKTLTVRSATNNDLEPLMELIQYAYRGGKPTAESWTGEEHLVKGPRITSDKLAQIISGPDSTVLICELLESGGNPRIVGCLHVYREETPGTVHIAMLAVDPDQQSAGVGSRLMRSMEDYARRHFAAEKIVGEVISGRPELMQWYERMGYLPTGATAPFLGPEHGVTPLVDGLHFVLIGKQL